MRSPRWIALLLAVMLVSGHTAGLQLIAWTGMAVERAQRMPVIEAVRSTFDGSRPCGLCRTILALKTDDLSHGKPQAPSGVHAKPDLAPAVDLIAVLPVGRPVTLPPGEPAVSASGWTGEVPTPPPQAG